MPTWGEVTFICTFSVYSLMSKKMLTSIIVVVGLILLVLTVSNLPEDTGKVKIKVGYLGITCSEPFFVAMDKGFFGEEGIDVESVLMQSSNLETEAVVRGDLDYGACTSIEPALQFTTELKALSFGIQDMTNHFDSIVTKKDNISNLIDLKGKKIAVFPGSTAETFMKKYLSKRGVDTTNIEFVKMAPNLWISALESGSVDAADLYEPARTIGISKGYRVLGGGIMADDGFNPPFAPSIISIKQDKKLTDKIKRAIDKAIEFSENNDNETRVILAKWLKLDTNTTNKINRYPHKKLVDVNKSDVQRLADILTEVGVVKKVDTSPLFG